MTGQSMSAMTAAKQRIRLDQKLWKYIRDANDTSVTDLKKTAIPSYKAMNKIITGKLDKIIGEHIKEKRKDL